MSTQVHNPGAITSTTAGRRPRRPRRTILIALGALVAAMLAFPLAANAAMTTFAAHDHGTLDIVIDGELIDLDQPRFHDLHPEFHIHAGHGNQWHHHPRHLGAIFSFERLTLHQALSALGLDLSDDRLLFDGTSYDLSDPAVAVSVHVGVAEVDPDQQLVEDGDRITIEIDTGR